MTSCSKTFIKPIERESVQDSSPKGISLAEGCNLEADKLKGNRMTPSNVSAEERI